MSNSTRKCPEAPGLGSTGNGGQDRLLDELLDFSSGLRLEELGLRLEEEEEEDDDEDEEELIGE